MAVDSDRPKHADKSAWISVALGIVIAYTGIVASWVVLSERTLIHEREIADHEGRIRKLESDREVIGRLNELQIQIVELKGEISAMRNENRK